MGPAPSEHGVVKFTAHGHQAPGAALGIPAETDVGHPGMVVTEQALHGIPVVDAVGTRQGVQGVNRLGANLHGVGDVALGL